MAESVPNARVDATPKRPWEDKFLAALASWGVVAHAAKAAKIHKTTAYRAREADPAFREAWDAALEENTQLLEAEAVRRAAKGTLRPVYQRGVLVGKIREYSDTLLIFMLKARRPGVYRDPQPVDANSVLGELVRDAVRADIAARKAAGGPPQLPGEAGGGGPAAGVADATAPRAD